MESEKKGSNSETSSEENDRQEQVKEDTGSSTNYKRSYECTFCKRGFTNAQALGGHMNIHRKDRVSIGKQVTDSSSISNKASEEYKNPSYTMPVFSSEPTRYYPILEAQRNHHAYNYYYPPEFSPSQPHVCNYPGSDFHVPSSQSLSMNEQLWGANLSLQIGSAHIEENQVNRGVSKGDDEVDLELRLGHHP